MLKYIKTFIPRSAFAKNVLTLITGTTIAQAIPVAISPILTRIYSPEDFGILAMFISVTSILSSISSGRYEFAVMLPKKDKYAKAVVGLCVIVCFFISSFIYVVLLICSYGTKLIPAEYIKWIHAVPFTVFVIGVFNVLNYYFSREKKFSVIALSNVTKSFGLSVFQLFLPMIKKGAFGLISGRIISFVLGIIFFLSKCSIKEFSNISWTNIKIVSIRYIRFPKYEMSASLVNNIGLYLNNIIIPIIYSTTTLGFFSLVFKVLSMPLTLISSSVSQVFFKEISLIKNKNMDGSVVIWVIVKKLGIISLLGFGLLFFISEDLFAFVFGEEWRVSGTYARYLLPLFMVRFVVSPLTIVHSVYEDQKRSLFLQSIMLIIAILVLVFTKIYNLPMNTFLCLLSLSMSLFYLARLLIIFRLVKNNSV